MTKPLLQIKDLYFQFSPQDPFQLTIDDLSIYPGERIALVGESGSGKTLTGNLILQTHANRTALSSGEILFQDQDLTQLSGSELNHLRNRAISFYVARAFACTQSFTDYWTAAC